MKQTVLFVFCAVIAAGCATPEVAMRNDLAGEVAKCSGGGRKGSTFGGLLGYGIEKRKDGDCVILYKANGFRRTALIP